MWVCGCLFHQVCVCLFVFRVCPLLRTAGKDRYTTKTPQNSRQFLRQQDAKPKRATVAYCLKEGTEREQRRRRQIELPVAACGGYSENPRICLKRSSKVNESYLLAKKTPARKWNEAEAFSLHFRFRPPDLFYRVNKATFALSSLLSILSLVLQHRP